VAAEGIVALDLFHYVLPGPFVQVVATGLFSVLLAVACADHCSVNFVAGACRQLPFTADSSSPGMCLVKNAVGSAAALYSGGSFDALWKEKLSYPVLTRSLVDMRSRNLSSGHLCCTMILFLCLGDSSVLLFVGFNITVPSYLLPSSIPLCCNALSFVIAILYFPSSCRLKSEGRPDLAGAIILKPFPFLFFFSALHGSLRAATVSRTRFFYVSAVTANCRCPVLPLHSGALASRPLRVVCAAGISGYLLLLAYAAAAMLRGALPLPLPPTYAVRVRFCSRRFPSPLLLRMLRV